MNRFPFFLSLCLAAMLSAAPLRIFVTISPMVEAVTAIGGAEVEAQTLLPPGFSPESYQPNARMLASLGKADALLTIGVPFEKILLEKLKGAFPNLLVVDGTRGMKYRFFEDGGKDPHVWLSASNMLVYANTVAEELCRLRPSQTEHFRARLAAYRKSLQEASDRNRVRLAALKDKVVLVYHPAFGYFLEEYGIAQLAIEEEGHEPTGGTLQQSLRQARSLHVPAIFVQPQFSPRAARTVAKELLCRVLVLDPLPTALTAGLEDLGKTISDAYSPAAE